MVNTTRVANSVRRPTIRLSEQVLRGNSGSRAATRSTISLSPRSVQDIAGGGALVQRRRRRGGGEAGAQALWYVGAGPGRNPAGAGLAPLAAGQVRVRARIGALSRGTEALVFAGRVPESEYERMRAPFMGGAFPVPGEIWLRDGGPGRGRAGGAGRPHWSLRFIRIRPCSTCRPKPLCRCRTTSRCRARCSPPTWRRRSTPTLGRGARAGRPDRGGRRRRGRRAGRLSLRAIAGAEVTLVDIDPSRAALARALGLNFATPDAAPADCDLVVSHQRLRGRACDRARSRRRRGDRSGAELVRRRNVAVPLGGAFHSRRLKLISSQVGKVAPSHRAAFTHRRRLAAALELCRASAARRAARAAGRVRRPAGASCRYPRPGAACSASSSAILERSPCSPSKSATTS